MDPRLLTCVIIRRNGEFLVGRVFGSRKLRWSVSRYDAWRTRDLEKARKIARKTGWITMLFNPVIGKTRVI